MAYSKQDARYDKPLDLSEYSAADMMADLGLHRRVSLPLQGRATVITPPPPDIHKRGPTLARIVERDSDIQSAWSSVYDPTLVESRDDGLGAGQMHRTGQNFIPDDVRRRSPPGLRRVRSAEPNGITGRFELGKRPGKLPLSRQVPETFQARRTARERGNLRSPDELDPEGDILAQLRIESKLRLARYKPHPAARIIGHHIAGNPPIVPKAQRSASVASFHASRIVPANPLVSQWGTGFKLATAKAGYDYALDLDAKKAAKVGPERALNKVNSAAPTPGIFSARAISKTTLPDSANTSPQKSPSKTPSVAPLPTLEKPIPFPDTTRFFPPSIPTQNIEWGGDKPLYAEAGKVLADVTNNAGNIPEAVETPNKHVKAAEKIPSAPSSPGLQQKELDLDSLSTHLPPTDDLVETVFQSSETLAKSRVEDDIEDTDISPESHKPPASESSVIVTPGSVHESLADLSQDLEYIEEEEHMAELLLDLHSISEAVQTLKAKYLDYEGFEATLAARVRKVRCLKSDILSEIDTEEKSMEQLKCALGVLRAKRVAVTEALQKNKFEKHTSERAQEKETMEAELRSMIKEHEALMKEHEESEDGDLALGDLTMADVKEDLTIGDVTMSDIKEEDEPIEEQKSTTESEQVEEVFLKSGSIQEEITNDIEKTCLEYGRIQEPIRQLEGEFECSKNKPAGQEKALPGEIFTAVYILKNEVVENDCPQEEPLEQELEPPEQELEPLEQELEECPMFERSSEYEVNLKSYEVSIDSPRECAESSESLEFEPGCTFKEADRESSEKTEVGYLEDACIQEPEIQAEKDRLEKAHLEEMRLGRERHENIRIERDSIIRAKERADKLRLEEKRLVREHMENVKLYEERFQADLSERRRVGEECLRAERDERRRIRGHLQVEHAEKARLDAEESNEEIQRALIKNRQDRETALFQKMLEGMRIERPPTRSRFPTTEQMATGPVRHLVFEERKLSVTPEPIIRPTPKAPGSVSADKPLFPYVLELDLCPMYGPPLYVQVEQFCRPQEAILKRCSEVLSAEQHRELGEMEDFRRFLMECNDRHSRRMAKAYGNRERS